MAEENNTGMAAFLADRLEEEPKAQDGGQAQQDEQLDGGQQPANPAEPTKTFFEEINKRFQTAYKSDDEVSELIKSTARIADYDVKAREALEFKGKVDELTTAQKAWAAEKTELEGKLNPLSWFKDQDSFIAEQLARKFGDRDASIIKGLLTKDLSRMDKVELLAQKMLMDNPDIEGGMEGAIETVKADLGIDPDSKPEEWSRTIKNKITVQANAAKKELEDLKKSVELPKIKTQEELQAEAIARQEGLKRSWTPYLDKMEAIDKLQIPSEDGKTVLATIDIPAEWRKASREELVQTIMASGQDPNEETISDLNTIREMKFIHANLPKLYTILENQWKSKAIEERDRALNNDQPPNINTRPDSKPDDAGLGMRSFLDTY